MENKREAHQIANCELCERVFNRPEPLPICQVCEKYLKDNGWYYIPPAEFDLEKLRAILNQKLWDDFRKARPDLDLPKKVEFKKLHEIIRDIPDGG